MISNLIYDNVTYNLKLAKTFGVTTAIYLTALCKLKHKCIEDGSIYRNTFEVNDDYIYNITGVEVEEQKKLKSNLIKLEILSLNDTKDKVKLNEELLNSIIVEENKNTLKNIKNTFKKDNVPKKLSQRQIICENLKSLITCSNQELLEAYKSWVDGVYANPKGFLSKRSIEIFQNTINEYTKGDLDIALDVINIATVSGYRDATWAINSYEERKRKSVNNRITQIKQPQTFNINTDEVF